jgi:hypothetical protein
MRLPKAFPRFTFSMDYNAPRGPAGGTAAAGERAAGA